MYGHGHFVPPPELQTAVLPRELERQLELLLAGAQQHRTIDSGEHYDEHAGMATPGPSSMGLKGTSTLAPPPLPPVALPDGGDDLFAQFMDRGVNDELAGRKRFHPFFRWFGPTAYTPGLKSVKVELQSSDISDSAESTAPPSRAAAFDPNSLHHLSPNHVSPFDLDSLSPGTTTSYSSSDSHDRTGWRDDSSTRSRQSAMEENRRRRDALFKKGKERVFPVDALFEDLLDTFFRTMACHFPFLSRAQLLDQHRSDTLSAILKNAICALASRFSDHPLLIALRPDASMRWKSALPFEETAQQLMVPMLSFPSFELASAIVLLGWNEFGSGRDSGLWMYTGMAIRVIQDLGMQHEASIQQDGTLIEVARRRLLFWSVFFLDRVISYGTGRKASLSDIDVQFPTPSDCDLVFNASGPSFPPVPVVAPNPWPALIAITYHRGRISDCLNAPGGNTDQRSRERVEKLHGAMIAFYQSIDPSLMFSVQSFKVYRDLHQSPTFWLLHMLFHSVITVLHRPSLLQNFSQESGQVLLEPNAEISRSSARTLANMLTYADQAGPVAILANPFADQGIFISAVAFIDERAGLEGRNKEPPGQDAYGGAKTPNTTRLLRSFTDSKLGVSLSALKNIVSHWQGVGWVIRTIEQVDQKKQGTRQEEIDPDTDVQAPPILFPRDPTVIKAWLAREGGRGQSPGPPAWEEGGWDETSMAVVPPDMGISFTGGTGIGSADFNVALDVPFPSSGLDLGGNTFGFSMDEVSPTFLERLLWGSGGGGNGTEGGGAGGHPD